ncbi:toprim domain-containing protein [Chitinophaga oryzae]|uniref:Toprim domain-containing protein n=1 Tax=Chitinophaga oryzae TaxID=2725414 RepID=A0ABX6LNP2_9BACT|nr:toprim domain-containing protein [Chitinophaga oryzae]QJB41710.1 toprim domain-containing protein [Chitinophaga oryzae]
MLKLSCKEARELDLVDYLASLGHHPQKIRNQDYWYLSPLRQERTPSFKVSRRLNMWYDHGIGKGGNLIDFGLLYFNCPVSDFLQRLAQYRPSPTFSFHPPSPASFAGEKKEPGEDKIVVVVTRPLNDAVLLGYIHKRRIPVEIARRFCEEVDFLLYGKKHTAIGFQNNAGGYELRNENFKGSSAPKEITFVDNHTEQIVVFEGFFSFLSFCTINRNQQAPLTNCLVLNSLSFFEKSRPLMEQYKQVHLILDRDTAGMNHTRKALQWDENKYIDRSDFYHSRKDLNDWLIHHHHSRKES